MIEDVPRLVAGAVRIVRHVLFAGVEMVTTARRSILIGAPLILGLLELGHPAIWPSDVISTTVQAIATWWTALHVMQVPLFALLGLAVFLLIQDLELWAATVSRYAIMLFVVVYPAFDGAVGISSGVLCQTLPPAQLASIEGALQEIFWGPVTGMMALVGSASWFIALISAAFALHKSGASSVATISLALSGLMLAISHVRPFGPLACLSVLIGATLVEFKR
jgi:hypothetical protein